jgi:hypothetical protein
MTETREVGSSSSDELGADTLGLARCEGPARGQALNAHGEPSKQSSDNVH